ncbi:hypothetical protein GPECTOR_1g373 [Gonium pectorale]|uniref:Guanylate cyclase domain-containing protein n=1 Tax=Gonium pectorale TaxID=33097 RepID=A0A150H2M7_GONPE|nr:hypothetical protein GPECTOR_1g373 [Gonium pectorale]|eukprot:KXZ56419.1 hypothetical protein GPECTOR_1g373 [Gonium pectorale]
MGLSAFAIQRQAMLLDPVPPTADSGYDAVLASPTAFGDAAQVPGKLLDLSYVVYGDQLLDWAGIQAQFKAAVMYNGSVVALPLIPAPQIMYYHLDIFKRDNLSVPQTWEEFTDLAERYHGRDGMMGACIMAAGCRSDSYILRMIFGSYVQTEGQSHGMYWDPDTMDSLVNTPAMEAALAIFRRLRAVGPNATTPLSCLRREYVRGQCLLSINAGTEFKVGQLSSGFGAMRGKMGMALMPGSTHVLNRTTRTLVPCSAMMCPLATGTAVVNGVELPVNRPITSSVNIVLLNGLSPPVYQFYVYNLFSYLASPSVIGTKGLLLAPNEILPVREEDLNLANVPVWVKAGYDEADVIRFLTVYNEMSGLTNINGDLKIRLTTNVTSALLEAALTYNNVSLNASIGAVMRNLEAALEGIVAAEGGRESFAQQYRSATTLAVTDIQDSTLLWESLPPEVMDSALKIHHKIIRELLRAHRGYESATEGDSFIVAFHRPVDAVLFAVEIQQALLDAPWPSALVWHPPLPGVEPKDDPAAEVLLINRPPARPSKLSATPKKNSAGIGSPRVHASLVGGSNGRGSEAPAHPSQDMRIAAIHSESLSALLATGPTPPQSILIPPAAQPLPSGSVPAPASRLSMELFRDHSPPTPRSASLAEATAIGIGAVMRAAERFSRPSLGAATSGSAILSCGSPSRLAPTAPELAVLVKAVSDAAHGGMVLFSESTREELIADEASAKSLQPLLVLWMGCHVLANDLRQMHLFQVFTRGVVGRLALQRPLRSLSPVRPFTGALEAPVRCGAVARVAVLGASTLLAWDYPVASYALEILHEALTVELNCLAGVLQGAAPYIAEGAFSLIGGFKPRPHGEGRSSGGTGSSPWRTSRTSRRAGEPLERASAQARSSPPLSSSPPSGSVKGRGRSSTPAAKSHGLGHGHGNGRGEPPFGSSADADTGGFTSGSLPLPTDWDSEILPVSGLGADPSGKLVNTSSGRSLNVNQSRSAIGDTRRTQRQGTMSAIGSAAAALLGAEGGGGGPKSSSAAGVMTVVFDSPLVAASWLLRVVDMLPCLDWPAELLQHPLCEEVAFEDNVVVGSMESNYDMVQRRLEQRASVRINPQRGRAGLVAAAAMAAAAGAAMQPGSCFNLSGQLAYRGKAWATLSKVSAKSKAGEVMSPGA